MKYEHSNYLLDVIMPQVKPTTFKVIALIARKTWGWRGRDSVELSYTDFQTMTGIRGTNTIKAAIVEAEPFINQAAKEGQGFIYSMKPIAETLSKFDIVEDETLSKFDRVDEGTISNFDREPYQNLTPSLSNFDTVTSGPKEKERKKEGQAPETYVNGGDPILELEQHFTRQTAIMPNPNSFKKLWEPALQLILDNAGDVETAKQRITDAIEFARNGERKYTISSPTSLTTIIANAPGDSSKTVKVRSR